VPTQKFTEQSVKKGIKVGNFVVFPLLETVTITLVQDTPTMTMFCSASVRALYCDILIDTYSSLWEVYYDSEC